MLCLINFVGSFKSSKKKLDGYSVMLVTKFWSNTYTLICGSAGKESACNTGDLGSIPRLGRSLGKGTGYPLQYSGLENSMDYTVHGRAKGWTRLSNFHFLHKIFKYGYITESFCYTHETNTLYINYTAIQILKINIKIRKHLQTQY